MKITVETDPKEIAFLLERFSLEKIIQTGIPLDSQKVCTIECLAPLIKHND